MRNQRSFGLEFKRRVAEELMSGERRRLWLNLLSKISAEPSMVASSRHLLYIGKKPVK